MAETQLGVDIWLEGALPHRIGLRIGDHAALMTPLEALAVVQTLTKGIETQGRRRNEAREVEPRIAKMMIKMDFSMALHVLEAHAIGIALAADKLADLSDQTPEQCLEWLVTTALARQADMSVGELEQITLRVKEVLKAIPPDEPQ